jgi:LmbE family N-acetylglucosaminyl deacetylase
LQFPEQITEEGLEPHKVSEAFLWGSESPDIAIDVTGFVEAKAESLSRHVSQVGRRSREERLERMERWASRSAEVAGVPYSENFRRIRFDLQSKNWRFMHT